MSLPHRARGFTIHRRVPLLLIALVLIPGACAPKVPKSPSVVHFEAFGGATADGTRGATEWNNADCTQFAVKVPGGGTVTADICMMNDAQNLYTLVSYPRTVVDPMLYVGLNFWMPGTGTPGTTASVDQYFVQGGTGGAPMPFTDAFAPSATSSQPDTAVGGTQDGQGALSTAGGMHVFEMAHPLNSADDAHDFSLQGGDSIDFCATIVVGNEQTDFPACGLASTNKIFGRINIVAPPIGGTLYTPDFEGRICGVLPDDCPQPQTPDKPPHPCVAKPALCEKPTFQGSGMFLYCTIKPCVVHDELPRNCMRKFPCPEPPVAREPPYYHLTFTGLNNDWDVVLVDREGKKAAHQVVPIEGGVVLSFKPDRQKHIPGLIGDYVAMFIMRESGRTGFRYDVKARLDTSDRHYAPPSR